MKIKSIVMVLLFLTMCGFSFAAYKGHENDSDVSKLLGKYPQLKGTYLDGCIVCHKSGTIKVTSDDSGNTETLHLNACEYCHHIYDYAGMDITQTLTQYGIDYLQWGRNEKALDVIENRDSDGDGFSNLMEINYTINPGSAKESPGYVFAPMAIVDFTTMEDRIDLVKQTIFCNSHKSSGGDSYNTYEGFKLIDVLDSIGIKDDTVSIDVIALDGYVKSFLIEDVKNSFEQSPVVFGLSKDILGDCGWVTYYGEDLRNGVSPGPADFILAYKENMTPYNDAYISPQTGKLVEEGPFRLVVPQFRNPGPPDNPSTADKKCGARIPKDYHFNEEYDHNADFCVKAVVAIRVNPLPEGTRDINWHEITGELINDRSIVIFGNLGR